MMEFSPSILVISCLLGFILSWSVGANDLGNVMSTALTSRAISTRQALIIAIVFEFAGAFFGGHSVSHTLQHGILNTGVFPSGSPMLVMGMLSLLLASIFWMTLASFFGLPVSITNTIVGGLIGFGCMAVGMYGLQWSVVGHIFTSWLLSPTIACFFSMTLFMSVQNLIFIAPDPSVQAIRYIPIYVFLVNLVLSMMVLFQGMRHFNLSFGHGYNFLLMIVSAIALTLMSWRIIRRIPKARTHSRREQFDYVEKLFSVLMFLTACTMVFAHGSNDVAIAMGPSTLIFSECTSLDAHSFLWMTALGCVGVVVGLMTYGRKVIDTVGHGITAMTPSRAFAATFAAAITVTASTGTGIPVSATQTLVGGVFGVGLARGIGALNLNTIRNIALSWLITMPIASLVTMLFYGLLKWVF